MSLEGMSEWLGAPQWMRDAECTNEPAMPWTEDGEGLSLYEITAMALVCARCSVLADCRQYVAASDVQLWGFWAGQTRPGSRENRPRRRLNDADALLLLARGDSVDGLTGGRETTKRLRTLSQRVDCDEIYPLDGSTGNDAAGAA